MSSSMSTKPLITTIITATKKAREIGPYSKRHLDHNHFQSSSSSNCIAVKKVTFANFNKKVVSTFLSTGEMEMNAKNGNNFFMCFSVYWLKYSSVKWYLIIACNILIIYLCSSFIISIAFINCVPLIYFSILF